MTWLLVALGLAAAALGLPAGLQDDVWTTTAGGLLLTVASLPHLWGGFSRAPNRRSVKTVHLVLWNTAMVGVIALILLAFADTPQNLARIGLVLYVVAAAGLLVTVNSTEVRRRRAASTTS